MFLSPQRKTQLQCNGIDGEAEREKVLDEATELDPHGIVLVFHQ